MKKNSAEEVPKDSILFIVDTTDYVPTAYINSYTNEDFIKTIEEYQQRTPIISREV